MILLKKNLANCKECIKKKEKEGKIGAKVIKNVKNVLKFYKKEKIFRQINHKKTVEKGKNTANPVQ